MASKLTVRKVFENGSSSVGRFRFPRFVLHFIRQLIELLLVSIVWPDLSEDL